VTASEKLFWEFKTGSEPVCRAVLFLFIFVDNFEAKWWILPFRDKIFYQIQPGVLYLLKVCCRYQSFDQIRTCDPFRFVSPAGELNTSIAAFL
jgi:hypothetical protein